MSYVDNRPLLTTIVYLGFVVIVSHRIIRDYEKLKSKVFLISLTFEG
jgi:hypothetical protein